MTTWIAIGMQGLVLLGAIGAIYVRISSRLTAIEARLSFEDRTRDDRQRLIRATVHEVLASHCPAKQSACHAHEEHATGVRDLPARTP